MIARATEHLRTLDRRLQGSLRRWPHLLVWSLALVGAVILTVRQESGLTVIGLAEDVTYSVAATTPGRLATLPVVRNQAVAAGQVVASLDDGDLQLDLREARYELDRLSAELAGRQALWVFDASGQQLALQRNLREFATDAEQARVAHLEALVGLAEDRIEQQGLELSLERTRLSYEAELAPVEDLERDRTAYEARSERVARQVSMVAELDRVQQTARDRYEVFQAEHGAPAFELAAVLQPLQLELDIQAVRIEKICRAVDGLLLRAPADGLVAVIGIRPGEVVATGQPVLSIVEPLARQVVAYLPDDRIQAARAGQVVRIRPISDRNQVILGRVADLGAGVQRLPERLELLAGRPGWGQAAYIPLPVEAGIRPGEAFEVSF